MALPTEASAKLALRTQQVIAYESNVTQTVDPLAGSWYVESLTQELEKQTWEYLAEIDRRGGTIQCIESGFIQTEISDSSYRDQTKIDAGEIKIVGLNCFKEEGVAGEVPIELLKIPPELERSAVERVRSYKSKRSEGATNEALRALKLGAQGDLNIQALILNAVKAGATLGEVSDSLRDVFGLYQEYAGY